jgi:HlyD family secretion protein
MIIAAAALLVVTVIVGARMSRSAPDVGPTATASRGSIERIVVASGTIEPEHLVEVRPRISGIVERFLVDAGDRVKAGQVVAELDREALTAAVNEVRAALHVAEVSREHSALELKRKGQLFNERIISSDEFETLRTDAKLDEARVEGARAALDRLEQQLGYATITAPIDGLVLSRDLNPGAAVASVESVTGGTILMTIADTSQMHLLGVIDENEIGGVRVGQSARIRTDSYPGVTFEGRVRKIASIGDRKDNVTSFKAEVTVLQGVDQLRPKMSADADIITDVHPDAVIIPEAALLYHGDEVTVDVVARAGAASPTPRKVRLGISNAARVEVLDGLSPGETVKLR